MAEFCGFQNNLTSATFCEIRPNGPPQDQPRQGHPPAGNRLRRSQTKSLRSPMPRQGPLSSWPLEGPLTLRPPGRMLVSASRQFRSGPRVSSKAVADPTQTRMGQWPLVGILAKASRDACHHRSTAPPENGRCRPAASRWRRATIEVLPVRESPSDSSADGSIRHQIAATFMQQIRISRAVVALEGVKFCGRRELPFLRSPAHPPFSHLYYDILFFSRKDQYNSGKIYN